MSRRIRDGIYIPIWLDLLLMSYIINRQRKEIYIPIWLDLLLIKKANGGEE